jgi:hypothetical protein
MKVLQSRIPYVIVPRFDDQIEWPRAMTHNERQEQLYGDNRHDVGITIRRAPL